MRAYTECPPSHFPLLLYHSFISPTHKKSLRHSGGFFRKERDVNQKKASTRAKTVFCFRSVEISLPSKYSKVAMTFLRTVALTPSCQPFCPVKMVLYVGNMIP